MIDHPKYLVVDDLLFAMHCDKCNTEHATWLPFDLDVCGNFEHLLAALRVYRPVVDE